ncbi:MAG: NAD-dependent epimerase/dehydratase family protein [Myxococcales bacterium]|nr:NAD-dependent epimerase/dehydratase family protein [Myxococcales bacterium]
MSFAGKNAVVTGGLGFIGSNLARRLLEEGARVTVVDSLAPKCGANRHNLADVLDRIRLEEADLCGRLRIGPLLEGADFVFNLAGRISHLDSMTAPFEDLAINGQAHLSLLEEIRGRCPLATVVYASTRQLYGPPRYLPVDEAHPVSPVDINGVHKFSAEQYHLLFARHYGLRACALRLTNTYGPRQALSHPRFGFVGWFINRALTGQPIELFGDGAYLRDLNHVDDVVQAFLLAAGAEACAGRVFNLSGPRASLEHIAQVLAKTGGGCPVVKVEYPAQLRKLEIGDYYGSSEAFASVTGWRANPDWVGDLARTVEWFRGRLHHYLPAEGGR